MAHGQKPPNSHGLVIPFAMVPTCLPRSEPRDKAAGRRRAVVIILVMLFAVQQTWARLPSLPNLQPNVQVKWDTRCSSTVIMNGPVDWRVKKRGILGGVSEQDIHIGAGGSVTLRDSKSFLGRVKVGLNHPGFTGGSIS